MDNDKFDNELSGRTPEPVEIEENEGGFSRREKRRKRMGAEIYEWLQCIVAALLFCVISFSFFVRIIGILGPSMQPNFYEGDRVILSNLFFEPERGDIIVLRKESFQDEPIIKRVIATEGQTVDIDFEAGIVYVDGTALIEPYVNEPTYLPLDFVGPVTVPEGNVFVMGDNRNHSSDSRHVRIGFVDERYIIGKVLLRVMPLSEFGIVE